MLERPEQRAQRLLAPHGVRGGIAGHEPDGASNKRASTSVNASRKPFTVEPAIGLLARRLPLADAERVAAGVRDDVLDVAAANERVEDERAVGDLDGGRPRRVHHISRRPSRA